MKQLRLILPENSRWLRIPNDRDMLWINGQRKPALVRLQQIGRELVFHDEASSGILHVTASLDGSAEWVLPTAILMLRKEPYRLAVELARGQANKLRNLVAEWEREGWQMPEQWVPDLRDLAGRLCTIIQASESSDIDRLASEWLKRSIEVGDQLVLAYSHWRLQQRLDQGDRPRFGCIVGSADWQAVSNEAGHSSSRPSGDFRSITPTGVCEEIVIPIDWSEIEDGSGGYNWELLDQRVQNAIDAGFSPTIGPLLDFRPNRLPHWIEHWHSDRAMLVTLLVDIVETVVGRYCDRVRHWVLTTGTNSSQVLGLSVESMEWLTCRLLEAARHIDSQGAYAVGIDQPWGWYAGGKETGAWPVEFLDAVLRGDCQRSPKHSPIWVTVSSAEHARRSLADLTKLLDRFRRLGVPLWIEFDTGSSNALPADASTEWIESQATVAFAKPWVERVYRKFDDNDWRRC